MLTAVLGLAAQEPLKNNPPFEHLADDHFLNIIRRTLIDSYDPGETIATENDFGETILIPKRTSDDTPIKVAELNPGDIFGEMTLFTGTPRLRTMNHEYGCNGSQSQNTGDANSAGTCST